MKLLDQFFPEGHKLRKFINRNTIKVSYSTMQNMKKLISKHNAKTVQKKRDTTNKQQKKKNRNGEENCNCNIPTLCPLNKKCTEFESVVYKAEVICKDKHQNDIEPKFYIGSTEDTFKQRWYGHNQSFNKEGNKSTTLSTYIWKLKNKGLTPKIKWSIVKRAFSFSLGSKKCDLCLTEKFEILKIAESEEYLNHRDELLEKCRHMRKHMLGDFFRKGSDGIT